MNDVKLIDLMPLSIRSDTNVVAACGAIQPQLDNLHNMSGLSLLYSNIDNLPESILQYLAVEHNVYGAEWLISETLQSKRELIKSSFLLNKLAGTRWAIERVFSIIGLRAEITEWFEDNAEAYTFRVNVIDVNGGGVGRDKLEFLITLINKYKPVSRHLTDIKIESVIQPIKFNAKIGTYLRVRING